MVTSEGNNICEVFGRSAHNAAFLYCFYSARWLEYVNSAVLLTLVV
jgi:hypothetical protein